MLIHAVIDPDQGERCVCGALAVVVFVLPLRDQLTRIAWCGEDCTNELRGSPTAWQLWSARRRLRRWWRTHDLLGDPTEAGSDPTLP